MIKKVLICCTLLVATTALCQIPDSKIQSLMSQAKKMMKYKGPVDIPTIHYVPATTLHKMFCTPNQSCPVAALYFEDRIYIDNSLKPNDLYTESVILHEMVHHIQTLMYGRVEDCSTWLRNERQAYRLQSKYLSNFDQFDVVNREVLKTIKCPL